MKRVIVFLAVSLVAAAAYCQTVEVTGVDVAIKGLQQGKYLLTVEGGQVTGTPVDTPDPQPPEPTERVERFRSAAGDVTDASKEENGAKLAEVYRLLSQTVMDNGLADYQIIAKMTKLTQDRALDKLEVKDAWKPVTDQVSDELALVAQQGGSGGDYAACLQDAAEALDSENYQIDTAWIKIIMEIIKIVLELLMNT